MRIQRVGYTEECIDKMAPEVLERRNIAQQKKFRFWIKKKQRMIENFN